MAITGSPDIFVSEQDLSTYVGSFDVTTAALVGDFEWGPVDQVTRISNEARLKTYFGQPNDRNFKDWLSAKNYLEYSNSLALVRVCLDSARNAYFKPGDKTTNESLDNIIPHYYALNSSNNIISKYDRTTVVSRGVYGFTSSSNPKDDKDITEIPNETSTNDSNGNLIPNAEYEKYAYSPLTEEYTELYNPPTADFKTSTVTNFPNYVMFINEDGIMTTEKASASIYQAYNATPNNVMDLNADRFILEKNGKDVSKIPDETISSMKLGSAYACLVTTDRDASIASLSDNEKIFCYFRKKYERKAIWKEETVENSETGTSTKTWKAVRELNPDWLFEIERDSTSNEYTTNGIGYRIKLRNDDVINASELIAQRFKTVFPTAKWETTGFYIPKSQIQINVKNSADYTVQEQSIGNKKIPILAKYPGKFGNRIHVAIINKPAYEAYQAAITGKTQLSDLSNVTKNSAISIIGNKTLADDAIVVAVSLYDPETGKYVLKEYGTFSLTKGSTDITGYDNYVFNFFSNQSNYVIFNREAFEEIWGYKYYDVNADKNYVDLTKSFINVDAHLTNGVDYQIENLGGSIANYSEVTTTISNGVDYEINTQMTPIVDKDYISDKTPIINITGGVGAYMKGWDLFSNEESDDTQVELLMQGGGSPEIGQYIIDLAEKRKDCLACVSPAIAECVNVTDPCDRIADGTGSYYRASSYAYMDGNYKYQYDSYNDVYRWMPLNADIAGLCALIDATENPWMSIGGRQIRNCIKLAFYPSKADRDVLFEHNVNAVTNFSNQGNVIWGDWTRISNSAFNFLGVRRMFLYVEKNIKQFARTIMFKQNDQITRDEFVLSVEPFLDGIVGGRGIQEYAVFAGSDVTSVEEMDKGIFRAKFAIKPVRSIRYVDLVFVAVRSDMSVSEVIE